MTTNKIVTKYDGTTEAFDSDKVYKVLKKAGEGLEGISYSQIMMNLDVQLYDGITTDEIQKNVIEATHNLISLESPDYEIMAGRLVAVNLRKQAYGKFEPPHFSDHLKRMIELDRYDGSILDYYTDEELKELDEVIDHSLDLNFKFSGIKQLAEKSLLKDGNTGRVIETPQMILLAVPVYLHRRIEGEARLKRIKGHYKELSTARLSNPTPFNAGIRTKVLQFSSCVKIDVDCNLESQAYSYYALTTYTSQKAGIGLNFGRIRSKGDLYQGDKVHAGATPYLKIIQEIKSNTVQGTRPGAITSFFPFWVKDVFDYLNLKNNRGSDDNRVRHIDYAMQNSRLLYRRYVQGKDITLFSPNEVKDLYEAFFRDNDEFEALYEKYENDPSISKTTVSSKLLIDKFGSERGQTGRYYVMNVDHSNTHSAFRTDVAPVYMSNLCMEITLPTKPLKGFTDVDNSEIALCTLSAINLGKMDSPEDLEETVRYAVYGLDEVIDYQNYPLAQTAYWAPKRRALGVGVVGYAHFLAKRGLKFGSDEALRETHRYFEAMQYYLLKASVELAKQKGPCELFHETKYSQGILPIDTYCKAVDDICDEPLHYDWEGLRADILKYGLRNSTLSALMPSETSSQVVGSTDGINAPRAALIVKSAKDGAKRQIVPDYKELGDEYDYKFQDLDNRRFIKSNAVMQKFIDQAISTNTWYNPMLYPGKKVPSEIIIGDILYAYQLGLKTLYYQYTKVDNDLIDNAKSSGDYDHTLLRDARMAQEAEQAEMVIDDFESCESGACDI